MSIESKIDHYAALVRTKISHLSMRLLGLEDAQIAAALVQEIQPIVDALGTYVPEYCLPDLCTGELPTFPVPEFNPNSPPPYSSIPDVPLPPKAPTSGGDWDVSCVGATTQFGLSSIYGKYTMYIDNEVEPRVTGEPHELINYAGANMSNTLFIDYDGYMYFTNLSSQNLKVRLVPVGGATATLYTETNPTLSVDANGVITACLAGI